MKKLLLLLLLMPNLVMGFDEDGFRDGMTKAQVKENASNRGYVLSHEYDFILNYDFMKNQSGQPNEPPYLRNSSLSFCEGKLHSYSKRLNSDNYNALVKVAHKLNKIYGPAYSTTSASEYNDAYSSDDARLRIWWEKGNEGASMTINTIATTATMLYVDYYLTNKCFR